MLSLQEAFRETPKEDEYRTVEENSPELEKLHCVGFRLICPDFQPGMGELPDFFPDELRVPSLSAQKSVERFRALLDYFWSEIKMLSSIAGLDQCRQDGLRKEFENGGILLFRGMLHGESAKEAGEAEAVGNLIFVYEWTENAGRAYQDFTFEIAESESFHPVCFYWYSPLYEEEPGFFLSHSSADDGELEQSESLMQRVGKRCWVDRADMPHSLNWKWTVRQILPCCQGMVIHYTEHYRKGSKTSDAIQAELAFARELMERSEGVFRVVVLVYGEVDYDVGNWNTMYPPFVLKVTEGEQNLSALSEYLRPKEISPSGMCVKKGKRHVLSHGFDESTKRYVSGRVLDSTFPGVVRGFFPGRYLDEKMSFSELFSDSECDHLTDPQKEGKGIIQFSFVIASSDGAVGLLNRDDRNILTKGSSILISCSPFASSYARFQNQGRGTNYAPRTLEDIREIYHLKVKKLDSGAVPTLRPLGLVVNTLSERKVYLTYIFIALYDTLKGRELSEQPLFEGSKNTKLAWVDTPRELEKEPGAVEHPVVSSKNKIDRIVLGRLIAGDWGNTLAWERFWGPSSVYISCPEVGRKYGEELAHRLEKAGYTVSLTPSTDVLRTSRAALFVCLPGVTEDEGVSRDASAVRRIMDDSLRAPTYRTMNLVFQRGSNRVSVCPKLLDTHKVEDSFADIREEKGEEAAWCALLEKIRETVPPDPPVWGC